ncbi:hypothetical protein Trydic_g22765 [Trypoxylus dichotomus]
MKILQILAICTAILSRGNSAKNRDEGRPYEFGFTIDGEQHRYEKKDANGIIQGEFGFITADGIYHVTTYATDENGSFRILSMRNVRISDPLDGSGSGFGKKIPASEVQGAGKKVQAPQTPIKQNQLSPPSTNQAVQTTTRRAPLLFTTQPTIKPACAGCGYVTLPPTTQKPITHNLVNKPPQNLFFQNGPSVSNQPQTTSSPFTSNGGLTQSNNYQGGVLTQNRNEQAAVIAQVQPLPISQDNLVADVNRQTSGGLTQGNNYQGQVLTQNGNGQAAAVPQVQPFPISQDNLEAHVNRQTSSNNLVAPQLAVQSSPNTLSPPFSGVGPSQAIQVPQSPIGPLTPNTLPQQPSPFVQPPAISALPPQSIPQDVELFTTFNGQSNIPAVPEHNRVSDIKVENGMILVPNNPPIPIKDKYPGMADGLPKGIEEKDIKDLLYKFNYTIGFHGHYEKGYRDGSKIGGYFVNGRDGISRVVTYVADEYGYRPKFKLVNLGLESPDTPKEDTEKTFGLKSFEFVWYPLN